MSTTVLADIMRIISDQFDVPPAELRPDTALAAFDADSLVFAELAVALQSRFGVSISEGQLYPEQTVEDLATLVLGHVR